MAHIESQRVRQTLEADVKIMRRRVQFSSLIVRLSIQVVDKTAAAETTTTLPLIIYIYIYVYVYVRCIVSPRSRLKKKIVMYLFLCAHYSALGSKSMTNFETKPSRGALETALAQ